MILLDYYKVRTGIVDVDPFFLQGPLSGCSTVYTVLGRGQRRTCNDSSKLGKLN
jgi:hypothetical protein